MPSWIHTSVSGRPVAPGGSTAVAVTVDRDLAPLGAFSASIRIRPSSGSDTATIEVRGTVAGPTALGKVSVSRRTAPVAVTADPSPSTSGSAPLARYDFNWGDGTHTSAQPSSRANHTYPRAGTYTIWLTVTDRASRVASYQWTVIVRSPLPGPTLVEPAANQHYDGAEQVITFTWSAVPNAVGYQLDLERLDGGNWVSHATVRAAGTSTTQQVVKFSFNNFDYFRWQIRAVDSDSVLGAPSAWRAFDIYEPGRQDNRPEVQYL